MTINLIKFIFIMILIIIFIPLLWIFELHIQFTMNYFLIFKFHFIIEVLL